MLTLKKQRAFFSFTSIMLLSFCLCAHAGESPAISFAKQAGVLAGAAQTCGQPISTFVMRAGEAINALALNPMDNTYATAAFSKAQQDAAANMMQNTTITCPKVINDFNSLPILQPDYEKTVIQVLKASNPVPPPAVGATPTGMGAKAATTNSTTPPANNINSILPTNTAAPQNYVTSSSTANSNSATPPINPGYASSGENGTQNSNAQQPNPATEAARLQLAQQLAQMAQTLVSNGQPTPVAPPGQVSPNNPAYNSALNEKLNGFGANNPLYSGQTLPPPNVSPQP